jgi:hypothetical protein
MTFEQFRSTLSQNAAPEQLSPALKAMWEDAKGNWSVAHSIAQDIEDEMGSWIHAYLHRKEGDVGNAGYWYRRAKQPTAHDTLEQEWVRIVSRLLGAGPAGFDNE